MNYCIKEDLANVLKLLLKAKGVEVLENKDYTELTSVRVKRLTEYTDAIMMFKAKKVHIHSIEPSITDQGIVFAIRQWNE